ncbi:hypothetical protein [Micromonospora parva]|uniref:hypothetical protein n=1 Tax=Micromonospora parva TaxID=1464048 RepID=UPI00364DC522
MRSPGDTTQVRTAAQAARRPPRWPEVRGGPPLAAAGTGDGRTTEGCPVADRGGALSI